MKPAKKIIVTGAGGLVGMNLLTLINKKKYHVIAIDKLKENINLINNIFPDVETHTDDLSKPNKWEDIFKDADCVIQLQAQIASPKSTPYVKNNIDSVKNVIAACKKYNIKNLIHYSSSVVISVADDHYTNTKRKGEILVKKSKVPHTILRPPLMYGCFDVKHLGFLTQLLEMSPIFPVPGSGKYMRQPLFVEDICKITIKLIEKKPQNKTHNIIGQEKINFIDLLKIIAKEKKLHRLFLPLPIPIFLFLLKIHSIIMRKKPFIPDQLKALTAGDDFPVTAWDKTFGIPYTPFRKGIKKMLASPNYKYRLKMIRHE
jgi:nucleoside-diphosphate-sugar epimerase